ncbi:MAG: hypothetical protein KGI71_04255 [Patescibacteria group bacterium]|nr:hypothetical protein [Patescibacteria group bacterium]
MLDLSTIDSALSAIALLQNSGNTQPQFERARKVLSLERARLCERREEPVQIKAVRK